MEKSRHSQTEISAAVKKVNNPDELEEVPVTAAEALHGIDVVLKYVRDRPETFDTDELYSIKKGLELAKCRSIKQVLMDAFLVCYYSRKGFFHDVIEKVKEEFKKDKELKDNIKQFRSETEKMEKSEELQKVREYYKKLEKEVRTDTSEKFRDVFGSVKDKLGSEFEELKKNDSLSKGFQEFGKAANKLTDSVSTTAKTIGESDVLKKAKDGLAAVEQEFETDHGKIYVAPKVLKTRFELAGKTEQRIFEANEHATGMVMHKDSKWFAAWKDFKDNSQYMQKFFDLKTQYDESENIMIRMSRGVTDRVSGLFGNVLSNSELQQVLTEIAKMDPDFSVDEFLRFCQFGLIPNVLEAIIRGDLKILEDWCHEAPFNVIAQPIRQALSMGLIQDSRILDIEGLDLTAGKIMEQGPVVVINFTAQQINTVVNKKGEVIEGDPNKILRVTHVWALCRDNSELNPWAAWRLLDIAMMPSEQWL